MVALHLFLQCSRRNLETVWVKRGVADSKRCMDWGEVLQVPATLNRLNPNILMIVQSAHCHCLVVRPWQKRLRWLLPPTLDKHEIDTEVGTNAGDVELCLRAFTGSNFLTPITGSTTPLRVTSLSITMARVAWFSASQFSPESTIPGEICSSTSPNRRT